MRYSLTNPKLSGKLLGLLWLLPLIALAEPKVVASIKPVHSLVAGVMQGIGEPRLLVPGGASPHQYSLRPSDARAISEADVVFWIGPELESFASKPLRNTEGKLRAVALLDAPGVVVLPLREGGAWEPHRHDAMADESTAHPVEQDHEQSHESGRDVHIWLDPVNAAAMVRQIVAVLSETDPSHRTDYQHNGTLLIERLNRLDQQLAAELAPIRGRPYVVFHDAYQYFERRYGLSAVGSIVLDPEQRPGAKRLADIQAGIRDHGVRCVFGEPQFQPALVETVIAGSNARLGVLDPEGGAELQPGPEAYFQLLQRLSSALRACLGDA